VAVATGPEALTARGLRTRQALLDAARWIFERDGYHEARVTDISKAAKVAHGTFYTYFESKHDVFRQVVEEMQRSMQTARPPAPAGLTPAQRIAHANRLYFEAYRANARMMAVLEQAQTFDDELKGLRRSIRGLANTRSTRAIARWQEEGLVDPGLDAKYVANALGSMVDRSFFIWLVLGEPHDPEKGLETLNELCARALGLADEDWRDRPPRARRSKSKALRPEE
jgi:AcrR family transcriptional regulator